jgi:predicted O-methyltransferase YrrM
MVKDRGVDEGLGRAAAEAIGFMPEDEGFALYEAGLAAPGDHPWVEIGSYCGKSAIYLGAAARERGTTLFSIDHHRGSEEHQPGEGYHDPRLTDVDGRVDTLPEFRRTISEAGLEDVVLGIAGRSEELGPTWRAPLGLVFIDGGHSSEATAADYEGWSPHLVEGGLLAIHDVFEDPAEGGRQPFEVYRRALASMTFVEVSGRDTLRVLQRRA